MMNMSYCRFNNTNIALEECLDSIKNADKLSNSEMNNCRSLFGKFIDFCFDSGILDSDKIDYGDVNENLEEFFGTIGDENIWN